METERNITEEISQGIDEIIECQTITTKAKRKLAETAHDCIMAGITLLMGIGEENMEIDSPEGIYLKAVAQATSTFEDAYWPMGKNNV